MISDLKPYTGYKESGITWLGEIPARWTVRRMKYILREQDSRSVEGKEQLLRVSQFTGVTQRSSAEGTDVPDTRADNLIGYKRVAPNDLVINIMLAWNGSLGVSRYPGIASPAYCVYRFGAGAQPWYFHHLLRSPIYKGRIKAVSTGVVESRLRLYSDDLYRIEAPLPPPDEQTLIVRFLDHTNLRIDHFIRAQKKIIALLNEQKQAIIHRAVTKGLDTNVSVKPSGIEWLGYIPEHWQSWRISRLARVGNGSTPSRAKPAYWNGGTYPWLNSSQVNRGVINSADQFVTRIALRECHLPHVSPGSVLVAITGQGKTRGTAAILNFEATINQHVAFITPLTTVVSPEFLHVALTAAYKHLRSLSEDSGSTKGALTCEDLKRFKIALPPQLEQHALVEYISAETATLDTAISRTEREISLLREYRTRLIADVVTGKLDVREPAKKLPEEATESGIMDDDAISAGDDEMDESVDLEREEL